MPPTRFAPALLALVVTSLGFAQAPPITEWSFEDDVEGWTSLDPAGRVSVTTDANVVRENGGGCLEYAYTPKEGVISGAVLPVPSGLAGAQSVRFWLRTSEYAMATVLLAEGDGSAYIAVFSSLPGAWQEVALGLDEFQPMDSTQDENGKLDVDQIAAIGFGDVIFMLDAASKQMPFIMAPDLGPRMLWVDDVQVTSEPVPPRWEVAQIEGVRCVRLDSFEASPLQWLTLAGKGIEVTYDREHVAHGEFSLRTTYNLPADKVFGVLTAPAGAPLAGMTSVKLSVMSEKPLTLFMELKERDESKYQATAQVVGGTQFEEVIVPLTDFALAGDSTDEDGKLDPDQLKEFLIADLSAVTGAPASPNTLWFDNILFSE
jgi:hypothetical protein